MSTDAASELAACDSIAAEGFALLDQLEAGTTTERERAGMTLVSELLSDPKNWTQRALARDKNGEAVSPFSPDAVAWCVLGALFKCEVRDKSAVRKLTGDRIMAWNDDPNRTFHEVQQMVGKAEAGPPTN
jgi:hypothetical protein